MAKAVKMKVGNMGYSHCRRMNENVNKTVEDRIRELSNVPNSRRAKLQEKRED